MKTKIELKAELASHVARKAELTRERVAYKKATPPSIERGMVLRRIGADCGAQKELCRLAGLALAFARGRPYWHAERRVSDHKRVGGFRVIGYREIASVAGADPEAVKAWLTAEPTAEELAAWNEHVARTKAAERAAMVARRAAREVAA